MYGYIILYYQRYFVIAFPFQADREITGKRWREKLKNLKFMSGDHGESDMWVKGQMKPIKKYRQANYAIDNIACLAIDICHDGRSYSSIVSR